MYSCAGVCSYEGRGGLCDIALSEPLLKLRPRKDLVETLLHEMIHAFLFITSRDRDRDGHGPNFQSHMHRINKLAGVNITIYHDFHDEVKLYLTHWWRCDGPCQSRKPYFGVVRRSANRAPGPADHWWKTHQKTCGGTFVKIKEPENYGIKKASKPKADTTKPTADITKYINNNNNRNTIDKNIPQANKTQPKSVLGDRSNVPFITKAVVKTNKNSTIVITQKGALFSPVVSKKKSPNVDKDKMDGGRNRTQSANVLETVRSVWANKQLPTVQNLNLNAFKGKNITKSRQSTCNDSTKSNKHKASVLDGSPPNKIKKIDDYFKKVATTVLKDVYGEDFNISQSKTDNRLIAAKAKMVDCPICKVKIKDDEINGHLDECLNKDVIEKLSKDNIQSINIDTIPTVIPSNSLDNTKLKTVPTSDITYHSKHSSTIKIKSVDEYIPVNLADISCIKKETSIITNLTAPKRYSITDDTPTKNSKDAFDQKDLNKVKSIAKKINYEKHPVKSGQIEPASREGAVDFGYLPSFLDDVACEIKLPAVKIEPGALRATRPKCPCCGDVIDRPIEQHLDDCLAFFGNGTTAPVEGASTSFANETIVIDDDDDAFDESQTLNATGTKSPCPCCLKMVEQVDMNDHLDVCLA
ncbi:unnamed protein product, partial [Iphiclides podalirius]